MRKAIEAGHGNEDMAATFLRARARALVIVDFQNDFTPGGALAVPRRRRDRRAASTSSPARATSTSSSPRATGTRPTTGPSPSGRPLAGPLRGRHARRRAAPGARPSARGRDRRQGPGPGHRGYSGFEGTELEDAAARARHRRAHGRRPGDRLLRQEHRPRRAPHGLRGDRRPRRRARRGGRAGDSERALDELREAGA